MHSSGLGTELRLKPELVSYHDSPLTKVANTAEGKHLHAYMAFLEPSFPTLNSLQIEEKLAKNPNFFAEPVLGLGKNGIQLSRYKESAQSYPTTAT